jgi:uncharacterized Zn-binding protein involved in type VI secretion
MFAAARIADPLTHDMIVPSGVIAPPITGPAPGGLVLIEGLPAAYATCSGVCTGAIIVGVVHPPPVPPAPPPPIVMGSIGVMINNRPAARWAPSGDIVACGSFLGDLKLLLTRRTFIGGISTVFFPVSTMTADGKTVTKFGDSIIIEGDEAYRKKVVRDLNIIAQTPSGKKLLASIAASGKTMRIHPLAPGKHGNWAWTDPPPTGSNPPGYLRNDGKPGAAANTEVGYDPDKTSLSGSPGNPINDADWAKEGNRPADVGLFHEMVHADDMMYGKMDGSKGKNTGPKAGNDISNFELRAAGIEPYDKEEYSENTYRKDRGLPERDFY